MAENAGAILKRARSEVRLRTVNQEETKSLSRTLSHRAFSEHPLLSNLPRSKSLKAVGGASKVKATFGEAKVRFTFLPTWGFRELQHEIARRFNIDNNIIATFDLKYLDDDKEWVLLTCEADLEECIDIYRSSQSRTIKISVHEASQAKLGGSFGIAILTTMIHVNSGNNRNILLENVNNYNTSFLERKQAYIQGFQGRGFNAFDAEQMANRAMEGVVTKQTMLVTYDNIYLLVGIFVLCCIPLVYLQKFKKNVPIPVDAH